MKNNLFAALDFKPLSGMSRQEAEEIKQEAMVKLAEIYTARTHLLGGASGAHSLLQFSHFELHKLNEFWRLNREPDRHPISSFDDMTPVVASDIEWRSLMSDDGAQIDSWHVMLHRSGDLLGLEKEQAKLLALCNGRHYASELVDLWIERCEGSWSASRAAKGFSILQMRLLAEKKQ